MSACARCGEDFTVRGTPWTWRPEDGQRVHVDCNAPSLYRQANGTPITVPKPAPAYSMEPGVGHQTTTRRVEFIDAGWSHAFVIRYEGSRCEGCGKPIFRNTKARHRKGDEGRNVYRHEGCSL